MLEEEGQPNCGSSQGYPSAFGIILVSAKGISIRQQQVNAVSEAIYSEATVENLRDAARVLAAWMDLKFEDTRDECRRVHDRDQFDAFLQETIDSVVADWDG